MPTGRILTTDEEIRQVLVNARSIAVLGLSPKPERDSHRVARYLQTHGYRIIPVRPGRTEILGEPAFESLGQLERPVDIVDVFRRPDQIVAHAREALGLKPRVFWMQLGIENLDAAELLTAAGIDVVMDRCIKIEHARLSA